MIGKFARMGYTGLWFLHRRRRIVTILLDNGFTVPGGNEKEAWLFERGMSSEAVSVQRPERGDDCLQGGKISPCSQMNKNK